MNMKTDTSKPSSTVGRLVKKALYGSAILGFAMGMQSAVADSNGFEPFTPFSRIATLPVVSDGAGGVNHVATYAKAKAAALHLADYVARTKDLGEGGDWVLGGTSTTCRKTQTCDDDEISHAILAIPSPQLIDPTKPPSKTNTKKASVLDFCNEHYAKQALGVAPIIGDKKVVNGYSHTPALPCEVSIWNDGHNIYVDMLDPNAIFTMFFTDVHFSDDMMNDTEFAEAISALPPKVKAEIKSIVQTAMLDFDTNAVSMDEQLGPLYSSMDQVVAAVAASPEQSPYKHVGYTRNNGGDFDSADAAAVAQAIINMMSIHGEKDEDGNDIAGIHPTIIHNHKGSSKEHGSGRTLDSILSPGSSWRSARPTPLPLPGKNYVIEACSPKFAKMAMGTGLHHVTALPCEITVQVIDRTGDGSKETLVVSYLDPHFMLGALFADISESDKQKFAEIPGTIMEDLQVIVEATLYYPNSDYKLSKKVIDINYDMLP